MPQLRIKRLRTASVSGKVITITLASNLENLTYETDGLKLPAGCVKDIHDNTNSLIQGQHAANWLPPQLISNDAYQTTDGLLPTHGSLSAATAGNLVLTFDRSVVINVNSAIQIKKYADDTLVQEISLQGLSPDNHPAGNALIIPHNMLEPSTRYYVVVPANAFGISGNSEVFFPGTGKNTWNFTTGTS